MRGDLDKLVVFVKNEFPMDAGEISDAAVEVVLEQTKLMCENDGR